MKRHVIVKEPTVLWGFLIGLSIALAAYILFFAQ